MVRLIRMFFAMMAMSLALAACAGETAAPMAGANPAPATAPYLLGAGDKLRITVFGETDLTGEYSVMSGGDISFPLIGNVRASGRTVEQVQEAIRTKLAGGYVRDPRVSAEVLVYRPFFILGEVTKPGQYPYTVGLTVQQAVATAGGYTYRANKRVVYLKQEQDQAERKIAIDPGQPLAIQPGDTIRIAERFF
jgi:polysaccharide biosynthesis/export protein